MESCILIDGPVLWVVIAIMIIFVFFGIMMSLINAAIQKESDNIKRENTYLRKKLSQTEQKLYKAKFKLPEVEDDG